MVFDTIAMSYRGAPIRYDPHRPGYHYSNMSWQLPGIDLTEGDLMGTSDHGCFQRYP